MDIIKIIVNSGTSGYLFCLVVTVPGYRSRDPVSIPGAIIFSEK
jgi:hypothetical protein